MESDETFVLDQLQPDQAAELRSIFKQMVRKYEKEELKGLNSKQRAEHRKAINMYYTRLFRVSAKPHPRSKRPSRAIKILPPDAESLKSIRDMEIRARELVERNEALKRENGELLQKLSAKMSNLDQEEPELATKGEPVDLKSIPEQEVLKWLSVVPYTFDAILEEFNEVDDKVSKTSEKLKSLHSVAERKLKRPAPAPSSALNPTSTAQPRPQAVPSTSSVVHSSSLSVQATQIQNSSTPKAWSFSWRPQ